MKKERLEHLEKQSPRDKTAALLTVLDWDAEDTTADLNTLAFGWDAITRGSKGELDRSVEVWDNVAAHAEISGLLQAVKQRDSSLPGRAAAESAINLLECVARASPDTVVQSAVLVAKSVLQACIYETETGPASPAEDENQCLGAPYWEAKAQLEDRNAALEDRVRQLEAKLADMERHHEETAGNAAHPDTESDLEDILQVVQSECNKRHLMIKPVLLRFFTEGLVDMDLASLLELFRSFCSSEDPVQRERSVLLLPALLRDQIDERQAEFAFAALFERSDATVTLRWYLDTHPLAEKTLMLSSRSTSRLVAFWEVHWDVFADMLWVSTELASTIADKRPDVMCKLLRQYSEWLGFGIKARMLEEQHLGVLEVLLNQVVERQSGFLESLLMRNRQTLRDVFESRSGEELVTSLAQTSPISVGRMIDCSRSILGGLLQSRAGLMCDLMGANARFLSTVARADMAKFARALAEDPDVLAEAFQQLPRLMDQVVERRPADLAVCIGSSAPAVLAVLEQTPAETLEDKVLQAHPHVLVENVERLDRLGLVNSELYRGKCTTKEVQTDPLQHSGDGGIKARPLTEVVGKRRLAKASAAAWTVESLHQTIANIYHAKVQADSIDDRAGHGREPLPEVIYDYFVSEFPDVGTAKKAMANFALAVRTYADVTPMLYWFASLVGAVKVDDFSPQGIDFYLSVLRGLVPADDIGVALSELDGDTVVPVAQAIEAVRSIASVYWYKEEKLEMVLDKLRALKTYDVLSTTLNGDAANGKTWAKMRIAQNGGQDSLVASSADAEVHSPVSPGPNKPGKLRQVVKTRVITKDKDKLASQIVSMLQNSSKYAARSASSRPRYMSMKRARMVKTVVLQHILDIVMSEWLAAERKEQEALETLFMQGDSDGNGILDLDEFKTMVMIVDPGCDSRTVNRMFKMTGEETDDGEHVISPGEFVQVMRAHKYTGPALEHLFT